MAATDTTSKTISQSLLTYILTKIKSFIPTNISELNNDKDYVTADYVKTLVNDKIKYTYDLYNYYKKIPNYTGVTSIPNDNSEYIKTVLPLVINKSCENMLYDCRSLINIDTTGWDTSKIIDMNYMFYNCLSLITLDVSNFDTKNVIYMNGMFYDCSRLTTLDVSNFDTSKVTNMENMFTGCNSLTTLDVSKWDTSKVTNMHNMFNGCNSLTTITGIIDMKSCTSYDSMFESCFKLTGVKIKNPPSGITATSGIGGLAAGRYEIVS